MYITLAFSKLISYYTDSATKKMFDDFRKSNTTLARINLKVSHSNLINEKITNNQKLEKANRIVECIRKKIEAFNARPIEDKALSITNIPFFDIDYKTLLRIINKNSEGESIPANKELQVFHKNLQIFERLFGFKFHSKSLSEIKNQSLIALDNIYPEIREFYNKTDFKFLLEQPIVDEKSLEEQLAENEDFNLLSEPS